ncbi:MAG: GTPase [Oscillospiraceae bacterium]
MTRDRIYGSCEWRGRTFDLMDTGGIEPGTDSEILQFMRRQAEIGIELADAIIMVTDVKVGLTAADAAVATILQRSRKPVILAVNKCDAVGGVNPDVYEFYALGLGDPLEVSAVHGHGTGDLLDWCVDHFPEAAPQEEDETLTRVAIVGRPNVGKSSLLNRILGEERVIVFRSWPAPPGTPLTAILKTTSENTASLIPPACAGNPGWMTPLNAIAICAPSAPLSGRTCAL